MWRAENGEPFNASVKECQPGLGLQRARLEQHNNVRFGRKPVPRLHHSRIGQFGRLRDGGPTEDPQAGLRNSWMPQARWPASAAFTQFSSPTIILSRYAAEAPLSR